MVSDVDGVLKEVVFASGSINACWRIAYFAIVCGLLVCLPCSGTGCWSQQRRSRLVHPIVVSFTRSHAANFSVNTGVALSEAVAYICTLLNNCAELLPLYGKFYVKHSQMLELSHSLITVLTCICVVRWVILLLRLHDLQQLHATNLLLRILIHLI